MNRMRKNIRLDTWDYSETAWYFITICCRNQAKLFGDVVDASGQPLRTAVPDESVVIGDCKVKLTLAGEAVRSVLEEGRNDQSWPRIVSYVVMPNHIHFVVALRKESRETSLGQYVHYVKSLSSKRIHRSTPKITVWQKGYYDHIVRDDNDLKRILEYIELNPARWANDKYFR